MATTPEIKNESLPQMSERPDTFVETPIEAAEGIQGIPVTPPPVAPTAPGQVVTPVPAPQDDQQVLVIPADPKVLTQISHGNASNTSTWNAWILLRNIQKALLKHWKVVIGGK